MFLSLFIFKVVLDKWFPLGLAGEGEAPLVPLGRGVGLPVDADGDQILVMFLMILLMILLLLLLGVL